MDWPSEEMLGYIYLGVPIAVLIIAFVADSIACGMGRGFGFLGADPSSCALGFMYAVMWPLILMIAPVMGIIWLLHKILFRIGTLFRKETGERDG